MNTKTQTLNDIPRYSEAQQNTKQNKWLCNLFTCLEIFPLSRFLLVSVDKAADKKPLPTAFLFWQDTLKR